MWNTKRREDGVCSGPHANSINYRYPIGMVPGNVIEFKEEKFYTPSTILSFIFVDIIPFIMGTLVILFFLCTTTYMGFSLVRLFYSDTLKPFKSRTLRALGKHHYHYRRRDSGDSFSANTHVTSLSSTWSKLNVPGEISSWIDLTKYKSEHETDIAGPNRPPSKNARWLHSPEHVISATSPPQRKLRPGERPEEYPTVEDILSKTDRYPDLNTTQMGVVPISKNRRNELWTWNQERYKKQVLEEKGRGTALSSLVSLKKNLRETTSTKNLTSTMALTTSPSDRIGSRFPEPVQNLNRNEGVVQSNPDGGVVQSNPDDGVVQSNPNGGVVASKRLQFAPDVSPTAQHKLTPDVSPSKRYQPGISSRGRYLSAQNVPNHSGTTQRKGYIQTPAATESLKPYGVGAGTAKSSPDVPLPGITTGNRYQPNLGISSGQPIKPFPNLLTTNAPNVNNPQPVLPGGPPVNVHPFTRSPTPHEKPNSLPQLTSSVPVVVIIPPTSPNDFSTKGPQAAEFTAPIESTNFPGFTNLSQQPPALQPVQTTHLNPSATAVVPPNNYISPPSSLANFQRPPTPISRVDLHRKYTFKLEAPVKFHTAIPKKEQKPWTSSFMVLRGGPRKSRTSTEETRKNRKGSDKGQTKVNEDKKGSNQ